MISSLSAADLIDVPESFDEANQFLYDRGLTDGLPVVPPTPERVAAMLAGTSLDPEHVVASIPPRRGKATVASIAANAVMAGCRPGYMPVILAAVEALVDPAYALECRQTATHAGAPLMIVNGPIVETLSINYGTGCFGPGRQANATLGRAIRLILLNLGGATPGQVDSATHGHPGKYTYCIAENEQASPWEPLHVERGFAASTSTVTVVNAEGPHSINDARSETAESLLGTIGSTMATLGGNNLYCQGQPVLVLGPEHARFLHRAGMSKDDIKTYLFEHARQPAKLIANRGMEILDEFAQWIDRQDDSVLIPIASRPEDIIVIVAGGGGPKSMCVPTAGSHSMSVTRPIQS